MQAELKVFDKVPGTRNIVVALPPLFDAVLEFIPEAIGWNWVLKKGCYGYGEYVCELEDRAATAGQVRVVLPNVLAHLGHGEYFEHAEFVAPENGIEVARIDSSFLLLRGPVDLLSFSAQRFRDTKIEAATNSAGD